MIKYFALIPFLLLISCSTVKHGQEQSEKSSLENLAHSQFGEKYLSKENIGGSYILVLRKYKKMEDLFGAVRFFVFEKQTQSIIFQDELSAGDVKWYSNFEIMAISRNVSSKQNESITPSSIYYYNVQKKEKRVD